MEIRRKIQKGDTYEFRIGDCLYIGIAFHGDLTGYDSASIMGDIVQVTDKAVKFLPMHAKEKHAVWLPKSALDVSEVDYDTIDKYQFIAAKIKRWFRFNDFQKWVFERYHSFSGMTV